jgi:hypothetical protein
MRYSHRVCRIPVGRGSRPARVSRALRPGQARLQGNPCPLYDQGRRAGGRTEKVDEALAGLRHRGESSARVNRHHHGVASREDRERGLSARY